MLKREECGESSTRNHVVTLREREREYSQPRQQQVYKGNAAFPSRMEVGLARNSDVLCVCVCACVSCDRVTKFWLVGHLSCPQQKRNLAIFKVPTSRRLSRNLMGLKDYHGLPCVYTFHHVWLPSCNPSRVAKKVVLVAGFMRRAILIVLDYLVAF